MTQGLSRQFRNCPLIGTTAHSAANPDVQASLGWDGQALGHYDYVRLLLCAGEPASVLVPVASERGDAFALPASTPLGATCLALFEAGQDAALAARLSIEFEDFGRDKVVALLRRRAGEPVAVPQELDPEDEARRRGFVPLAEHTGVGADLGPLWPARRRISRDDLGERGDDPDDLWLVRSPWESLSVVDVIRLLWRWVEREPYPTVDGEWSTRVLEFFDLSEDEVRRLL